MFERLKADAYGLGEIALLRGLRRRYGPGSDLYKKTYFDSEGNRRIVFVKKALDTFDIPGDDSGLPRYLNSFLEWDREPSEKGRTEYNTTMVKVKDMDERLRNASQKEVAEVMRETGKGFTKNLKGPKPPHYFRLVHEPGQLFMNIGLGARHEYVMTPPKPGMVWVSYKADDFPFKKDDFLPQEAFRCFYEGAQEVIHNIDEEGPWLDINVRINRSGDRVLIHTEGKSSPSKRTVVF
jgi:hypothetical protein